MCYHHGDDDFRDVVIFVQDWWCFLFYLNSNDLYCGLFWYDDDNDDADDDEIAAAAAIVLDPKDDTSKGGGWVWFYF